MTEYSCKPAPAGGPGCYVITIDFDRLRWIERTPGEKAQPVIGISGLYRPRTIGHFYRVTDPIPLGTWPQIIDDPEHLLRAIERLESLALHERPPTPAERLMRISLKDNYKGETL